MQINTSLDRQFLCVDLGVAVPRAAVEYGRDGAPRSILLRPSRGWYSGFNF